jgi:hypothetical protein
MINLIFKRVMPMIEKLKRRDFLKIGGSLTTATVIPPKRLQSQIVKVGESNHMESESFIDVLNDYGKLYPPSLIYREGQDFKTWQKMFAKKIESLRGPMLERIDPEYKVLRKEELSDHFRLLIRYPVTKISTGIAYLLIPKNITADEKRAAIVALHGHAKYGIDHICGVREGYTAYALSAVQSGFVVIAPAWWGWMGRDGHVTRVGTDRDKCNTIQVAASMYGFNVLDMHIQDGQAAIDILSSLPEVASDRIGCMGNSYGGRTTMWLTIFEQRIKACVPSGCMNNFRERSLKLSSCALQYFSGVLRYGDVPELFSLIAPRPMQLQAGVGDKLITPADRDAMKSVVNNAYRKLGKSSNFEYVLHPEGHSLQWKYAESFFEKHL